MPIYYYFPKKGQIVDSGEFAYYFTIESPLERRNQFRQSPHFLDVFTKKYKIIISHITDTNEILKLVNEKAILCMDPLDVDLYNILFKPDIFDDW